MIRHPNLLKWETKLKKLLDIVDDELEDKFGSALALHPARQARGKTSNKAHDGLFDITAGFSMGLGSKKGRGYVIDIHMSTLDSIDKAVKDEIESYALSRLQERVLDIFPEGGLQIEQDGGLIKIFGDLSFVE